MRDITVPAVVAQSTRVRSSEKILYAAFIALFADGSTEPTATELATAIGAPPGAIVDSLNRLTEAGLIAESTTGRTIPPIPATFYTDAGIEAPTLELLPAAPTVYRRLTSVDVERWFQTALVARLGKEVQFTPFDTKVRTQAKTMLTTYGPGSVEGMVKLYVDKAETPTWSNFWFNRERWNRTFQESFLARKSTYKTTNRRVHDDEYSESKTA
jgi:hypothetical protein